MVVWTDRELEEILFLHKSRRAAAYATTIDQSEIKSVLFNATRQRSRDAGTRRSHCEWLKRQFAKVLQYLMHTQPSSLNTTLVLQPYS
jgi:hypothetical protein